MLGTSEYADNLFLRLASYSGSADRAPLEDFCSEALAWCLRQSPSLIKSCFQLADLRNLKKNSHKVWIHSQQSFEEENVDEDLDPSDVRGRFDIALEAVDGSFFVAIESKVGAAFRKRQLDKYRRYLKSLRIQNPGMRCMLLTLTNIREEPLPIAKDVRHLFWGDIHNVLFSTSVVERSKTKEPKIVFELMKQFAEFLKVKGLAYMTIKPITPASLRQFATASQLWKDMEGILVSLKTNKHLKPLLARKRVKLDRDNDVTYLGMYGSWRPSFFYIGFAVYEKPKPRMTLYIERAISGNRSKIKLPIELKRLSRRPHVAEGKTWFVFEKEVSGRLNGDAEAMRKWFHTAGKTAKLLK